MPRHTRRSFAVSAVALAGLGAATISAQEATPTAGIDLASSILLRRYLDEVITYGNHGLIYELFDADVFDLNKLYWKHVEEDAALRGQGVSPKAVLIDVADGMGFAIGHGTQATAEGDEPTFYLVRSSLGTIVELRRLSGETYTPIA